MRIRKRKTMPVPVEPFEVWVKKRQNALIEAIHSRKMHGLKIPTLWASELELITEELIKHGM